MNIRKDILACPICYERVSWNGAPDLSLEAAARSSLHCCTCRKSNSGRDSHLDLTVIGGNKVYGEFSPPSTELFRFPLLSFLYERGWRQSFSLWGGFPGPEKEFELMKDYLKPVLGGNIVDASCGSGMFSRLFAKSGLFWLVIALDFSEAMLRQCYDFMIKQEDNFPKENIILVRAARHLQAFIRFKYCGCCARWCCFTLLALIISRSCRNKPCSEAGRDVCCYNLPSRWPPFVSSTTLTSTSGSHIFLFETELEELCTSCGLVNFTCTRNRRFVMISAMKPV